MRAARAAAFALSLLAASELSLRALSVLPRFRYLPIAATWSQRMWGYWLAPEQDNFLIAPFRVFANRGFDDEARLRAILPYAKLPPNGSWSAPDFFQSPDRAEISLYHVHSNALGFRDPPRDAAKARGVFRIVALGSCQTFGHGVEDDEAYPRRLEALLNARSRGAPRFEVWNGGKQAATAITGLARLRYEILEYKPDLLIVDYGHTDASIVEDDTMTRTLGRPWSGRAGALAKRVLRAALRTPLGKSYLLNKLMMAGAARQERGLVEAWEQATRRLLDLAAERHVPVILLDQRTSAVPIEAFERLARRPGVSFLSVRRELDGRPPTPQQLARFRARYDWTAEFGSPPGWPKSTAYYVDMFFPNPMGYQVLAELLAQRVARLVPRR